MTPSEAANAVRESKQRLLEWGMEADAAFQAHIADLKSSAELGAKKALPWGVGIAAGLGLFALIGGRRAGIAGAARSGVSLLSSGIKAARVMIPIVMPLIMSRLDRDRSERH